MNAKEPDKTLLKQVADKLNESFNMQTQVQTQLDTMSEKLRTSKQSQQEAWDLLMQFHKQQTAASPETPQAAPAQAAQPESAPAKPEPQPQPKTTASALPQTTPSTVYKPLPVTPTAPVSKNSLELKLGQHWFSWIGILCLLVGVLLAVKYSLPYLGPLAKLAIAGATGAGLYWLGDKLLERFNLFSRLLRGGGLAMGYITVYAAFFFPDVAIIHMPILGFICLFAYALGMLTLSLRAESQAMAGLALLFGFYTVNQSESVITALSCAALLNLALVSIRFIRPQWSVIPNMAVVFGYFTYLHWYHDGTLNPRVTIDPLPYGLTQSSLGLSYLVATGLTYMTGAIWQPRTPQLVMNYLNTFLFYFCCITADLVLFQAGMLEMVIASIHFTVAILPRIESLKSMFGEMSEDLTTNSLVMGLLFVGLGTMRTFDDIWMSVVFASEVVALSVLSRFSKGRTKTVLKVFASIYYALAFFGLTLELIEKGKSFSHLLMALWVTASGLILDRLCAEDHDIGWLPMLTSMFLLLLTIFDQVPGHWITVSMVCSAFALIAGGFVIRVPRYRWMGMGWLVAAAISFIIRDLIFLDTLYRIALFIVTGGGLLAASYGYNRLAEVLESK